jgi:hypothetical protein
MPRGLDHPAGDPREPVVVWVPLILLAIPSLYSGAAYVGNVVFGDFGVRS